MKAEDIFGLLVPITFVAFLVTEQLFPRRQYPPIRFWTLMLGTFVNPETFDGDVGFAGNAQHRRAAMLFFRDVNAG